MTESEWLAYGTTESEWLAGANPGWMLKFLRGDSERPQVASVCRGALLAHLGPADG
jgi:hypothetical protein